MNHEIVVSTQVPIELRSVMMRKLKPALSFEDTHLWRPFQPPSRPHNLVRGSLALTAITAFDVVAIDHQLVLDAHVLAQREQPSWFDALIVEAAIRIGCTILLSEGMAHGRHFSGLRVCNPLLASR